jgi:NADPH2:quinone reductase
MRAIAIDRFGEADTLTLQDLPAPEIGPDEVLIRLEAAGVAVWDAFEREGEFAKLFGIEPHFPYVLGSEGAGTIAAMGKQVSRGFQNGDRVYAAALMNPKGGFYAEYAAVKADNVSRIAGKLTVEQAAVMPIDALTALRGLEEMLRLKTDETLMIFGASGGIGHMAVQLANRIGARVFAVASGDDGVALVKELGADATVDGRKDDVTAAARAFVRDGFDAALVTAGGEVTDRALGAVRDGGRVTYPNGVMLDPKVRPGAHFSSYDGVIDQGAIAKLNHFIETGPFQVHVARTFPLEEAVEAHRALNTHFVGKLALRLH